MGRSTALSCGTGTARASGGMTPPAPSRPSSSARSEKHCGNTRVMMKKFKRGAGERLREENGVDRLFFGRLPSDCNFTSSCENILVKLYLFLMFFVSRVRPQNNRKTC